MIKHNIVLWFIIELFIIVNVVYYNNSISILSISIIPALLLPK